MKTNVILMTLLLQAASFSFANNVVEEKASTTVTLPENAASTTQENAEAPKSLELKVNSLDLVQRNDWGDEDEDEFKYSRRLRRFHNTSAARGGQAQNNGRFGWGYYDPYYTSDVYYTINTPCWNTYYYQQPVAVVTRPSLFWALFGLNVNVTTYYYTPTYFNYGYYNPSPWGGWGGWNQGCHNGWNNGYNQGFNNGYYNGYNNGFNQGYWDGYNQGYNNGMYGGYYGNNYGGYNNGYGYNGDDWWYWKQQQNNSNNNSQNGNFTNTNYVKNPGRPDKNPTMVQNANNLSNGGPREIGGIKQTITSNPSVNSTPHVTPSTSNVSTAPVKPKWNTDTYQVKNEPIVKGNIPNSTVTSTPKNPSAEPVRPSFNGNQPTTSPVKGSTSWNTEPVRPTTNTNSSSVPKPREVQGSTPWNAEPRPTHTNSSPTPKVTESPRNQGNGSYSTPKNGNYAPQNSGYQGHHPSYPSPQTTQPTRPKYESNPVQNGNFGKQPNSGATSPSAPSQWHNSTPRATQNGQYPTPRQGDSGFNSAPAVKQQPSSTPRFEPRSNTSTPSKSGGFDKAPRPTHQRGGLLFEDPFEVVP